MHLNLAAPYEDSIGYGVCGVNLAVELARRVDLNVTCIVDQVSIGQPIQTHWLLPRIRPTAAACDPSRPTLYVQDVGDRPPGAPVVLYTCLDTEQVPDIRRRCYEQMDHIVVMSSWNERTLRAAGFDHVTTVVQGVDPGLFFPPVEPRRVFEDRMLFFSGGKFEYRKGQDVVLAAWKQFHARRPDCLLVAAWHNAWPETMKSMRLSSLIEMPNLDAPDALPRLAECNGIDPESILWLPPLPNWTCAEVYRQCDVGVFPTRAEPATNLPMMELMACGRPVIASQCAGQTDVLDPGFNAVPLTELGREPAGYDRDADDRRGQWWTPSVEELVERMDWCYRNRDDAARLGAQAAADIRGRFTWSHTADGLLDVIRETVSQRDRRSELVH